jgi:YVTN family beta-propeller protein
VTHSVTVKEPVRIAVDPLTHLVYAANFGFGNVVVINGRTNKVAAAAGVGEEPLGAATDPSTNTVYVANLLSRTVTVLAGSG